MFVRALVTVVALSAVSLGANPGAPPTGTAAGSMTVSGKASTLGFVHAFPKKTFGRPAVLLVFSDILLSAADAADDAKLSVLGNSGKLHGMGILVGADPSGKPIAISNEIYDVGFKGRMSIGGEDSFEARKSDDTSSAGHLFLKPAKKFDNGVTFTYDVTFDAPIER
ncbi:MAG: hypothetical protein ABJC89_22815 [Acidobacteriota bacterium]